jgi:hypothetical protein
LDDVMIPRKAFVLALSICGLVALPAAGAAAEMAYLEGLSFLDSGPAAATSPSAFDALNLSVVRDGTERTLRVPLVPREDARAASRIVPYLSVGSSFLVDGDTRDAGVPLYEDTVRAQRKGMDVGAGLAWRITNRLELFGEYRFLRMNPDPAESVGGGLLHRDVDGPFLKGGFQIRLP